MGKLPTTQSLLAALSRLVNLLPHSNLRKVDILLKAIDRLGKAVEYYALDLSQSELERTLSAIPENAYKHVKCYGLHGTYDDGLDWLKLPQVNTKAKYVLSLGSSVGNFSRPEAAAFLREFADALQPADALLVGIDACKDPDRVLRAYNDSQGVTHKFILNGLLHANQIMSYQAFKPEEWKVIGEYNDTNGRHQAFVSPLKDVSVAGAVIKRDEKVRIEESHKYDQKELLQLWKDAGVVQVYQWSSERGDYCT